MHWSLITWHVTIWQSFVRKNLSAEELYIASKSHLRKVAKQDDVQAEFGSWTALGIFGSSHFRLSYFLWNVTTGHSIRRARFRTIFRLENVSNPRCAAYCTLSSGIRTHIAGHSRLERSFRTVARIRPYKTQNESCKFGISSFPDLSQYDFCCNMLRIKEN